MNRFILLSLFGLIGLSTSMFTPSSFACIGGGKVDISFKRDSQGEVIVALKPDSGKSKELLDDTGFVSMNMAAVHLVKAARDNASDGMIDGIKYKAVVAFLKARAAFFKKVVTSAYPASGVTKFTAALDDVVSTAEKPKFQGQDLELKLEALTRAMYESKITIMVAVRDAGDTNWQPERLYRELGLPEAGLTRALAGCNASTAFNPNIGAMPTARADAEAMPSFSVK